MQNEVKLLGNPEKGIEGNRFISPCWSDKRFESDNLLQVCIHNWLKSPFDLAVPSIFVSRWRGREIPIVQFLHHFDGRLLRAVDARFVAAQFVECAAHKMFVRLIRHKNASRLVRQHERIVNTAPQGLRYVGQPVQIGIASVVDFHPIGIRHHRTGHAILSRLFCRQERRICFKYPFFRKRAVRPTHRHANMNALMFRKNMIRAIRSKSVQRLDDVFGRTGILHRDPDLILVTAKSSDCVSLPQSLANSPHELLQHPIPRVVTPGVVDPFEIVEIAKDNHSFVVASRFAAL